ncbi:LysR family transcriptional regulator [Enterovirga rhinocerotis]|uniref:LysR family transcriptional regulator n=1 Tax=Enterovirga rhinocerotis TaxID=1339210 RepID=A0A4R7BNT1_9HYPH|nr:LysR family transcriptional regulator [Enterovirga rhinocerotis]TDR87200.1 LysR family transcriptional regulator [Enterovirga rhinocerotis]
MDRLDALRVFARVVDCESFSRAAETLRMPRSSVSTCVKDLETRLGTTLLHRTTRRVSLTPDGAAFYERCLRLLADYEDAETLFRGGSPARGRLRVSVPGRFGRLVVAPALPDFFARYPELELEIGVEDRPVDLVEGGFDCAVRVGGVGDEGLIARPIGDLPLINCASPAYLARHGAPREVADLAAHLEVGYASPGSGRIAEWEYVRDGETHRVEVPRQVTVNCAETYIACCLAGLGLIQIPAYDVRDHLAAGDLVEVMPDLRAEPMPLAFVYAHRSRLSRRLKVFMDWAGRLFADEVLMPG